MVLFSDFILMLFFFIYNPDINVQIQRISAAAALLEPLSVVDLEPSVQMKLCVYFMPLCPHLWSQAVATNQNYYCNNLSDRVRLSTLGV